MCVWRWWWWFIPPIWILTRRWSCSSPYFKIIPRQLVSISLEKTGSISTTGNSGLLHPPHKLSCRTCCNMLTEHLASSRQKVMRIVLIHQHLYNSGVLSSQVVSWTWFIININPNSLSVPYAPLTPSPLSILMLRSLRLNNPHLHS